MIEDFIDNEKLLKLYSHKQYCKEYHIKNRDKINKKNNELYHNKYKKDEGFLMRVSKHKKDYYRRNENIKINEIFNNLTNKFNIDNELLHTLKEEFDIKIKK